MPRYILGARAHDYGRGEPAELFQKLAADAWECTQLAFRKAVAGVKTYADVTPRLIAETHDAAEQTRLRVAVLGTYVELGAMEEDRRLAAVRDFISQIPVCRVLSVPCIASETTPIEKQPPGTTYNEAQKQLLKSLDAILPEAERAGVTVALEPVCHHALNTPEAARMVLDTMRSDRLKLLFDPANLLSREWEARQDVLFGRAMELWGDQIMAVHFKGVRFSGPERSSCAPEQSAVDYRAAFRAMSGLPQAELPVLREEAVPAKAAADQAFMRSFFV